MRVLFLGSGEFAIPTLEALVAGPHEVATVVTQPDRPHGRGRSPAPTPVKRIALERGLEVISVPDVNEAAIVAQLLGAEARLGVVVAFGQKIGPALLDGLPGGMVNLHASLLPRHRGAAPINRAILAGDATTGVTVFRLTDRMDAGAVLARRETPIGPTETAAELHDRLARLGPAAVDEALAQFEVDADPPGVSQDDALATHAGKLSKADGILDFSQPADDLSRRIRGLWSWPGASCRFLSANGTRDELVTLARAAVVAADTGLPPGCVTPHLTVAAGIGALRILELKPAGGRLMPWADFVNGRRVLPGDRFERP